MNDPHFSIDVEYHHHELHFYGLILHQRRSRDFRFGGHLIYAWRQRTRDMNGN